MSEILKKYDMLEKYEILSNMTLEQQEFFYRELSAQRHDFMNSLQVIIGYLQADLKDKAVDSTLLIGRKSESKGRLHRYGLFLLSKLVEKYQSIFGSNENKLEFINVLPPSSNGIQNENKYAIELIAGILDEISKIPEESLLLEVMLLDNDRPAIKIMVSDRINSVLVKYLDSYKEIVDGILIGGISGEENLGFIQFELTKS